MDKYIVSARKYRPSTFADVIGQDALTITLKNAIKNNQLAHAYLFCGPRGVGKTTCARIFAKTINCLNIRQDGEACNECESCKGFNEKRAFNIFELDAASNNSVDDMRNLIEQVRIPPQIGKYKVYIIDEVHMLSQAAFNAFLKTLEEPPAHAIFILATTEKHKILPTILSRCQIYDFNRISIDDIIKQLKLIASAENIEYEEDALNIIATKSDGGMRDALSTFDQIKNFCSGKITFKNTIENLNILDYDYYFKLTSSLYDNDYKQSLLIFDQIINKGFDGLHFINGLSSHFRDLLVSKDSATVELLDVGKNTKNKYIEQAKNCDIGFLYAALRLSTECSLAYRTSPNKRLLIELNLIRLSQLRDSKKKINELIKPFDYTIKPLKEQTSKIIKKKSSVVDSIENSVNEVSNKENNNTEKRLKKNTISLSSLNTGSLNKVKRNVNSKNDYNNNYENNIQEERAFTDEQFTKAWIDFSETIRNNIHLYNSIKASRPVKIKDCTYRIDVFNDVIKEKINRQKVNIEYYLRKALKNKNINIEVGITTKKQNENNPFTDKEKLDYMIKKNPNLLYLYKKLGLDLS